MQQEAQEFIKLLLEDINCGLNEIKVNKNYEEINYTDKNGNLKYDDKYYIN